MLSIDFYLSIGAGIILIHWHQLISIKV